MDERKVIASVAPCGLVCALCPGAAPDKGGCPGCRHGGGDADCPLRKCAIERELVGCWECADFPCEKGMFGNPEWRGLGIASIECIKAQAIVWQDSHLFRQTGDAYLFITSFNEWPERSGVEPTAEVETYNRIWDFRYNRRLYLQPHRFEFLEGVKEGKRIVEQEILPTL